MSKRFLKNALYSARRLFEKQSALSFIGKYDYEKDIQLMLKQLHNGGYQLSNVRHFKRRHVDYLIEKWKQENLSTATIKNRLAKIRFVCKQFNKEHIMPVRNAELGIGSRFCDFKENRAVWQIDISKIENIHVRCSVRLQQEFGLRREESIKFIPSQADKGDHIRLQASWTKGGIPRCIPITRQSQRDLLNVLKRMVMRGKSLIPDGKSYRKQKNTYTAEIYKAGFRNLHGLRYAYAQKRYRELTDLMNNGQGWECPKNGGKPTKELFDAEKQIDRKVRMIISNELGHSRIEIVKNYCG